MSGEKDRIQIFPSPANLVMIKNRTLAAVKGMSLLKRKRDALDLKLREHNAKLTKLKSKLNDVMREAIFSIAKTKYLGTDFKPAMVGGIDRADIYMLERTNKMVGLKLPTYELIMRPAECFPMTGLSRGGAQVEVIREAFREALKTLIGIVSLGYSVRVLTDGVKQTNKRVNGLDYVVIPRFTRTVNYIRDELDEYEREDFFRLKRLQAVQRKRIAKFEELIRQKNALVVEEIEKLPEDITVEKISVAEVLVAELSEPLSLPPLLNYEEKNTQTPPLSKEKKIQTSLLNFEM